MRKKKTDESDSAWLFYPPIGLKYKSTDSLHYPRRVFLAQTVFVRYKWSTAINTNTVILLCRTPWPNGTSLSCLSRCHTPAWGRKSLRPLGADASSRSGKAMFRADLSALA